jgi:hypothetical protein
VIGAFNPGGMNNLIMVGAPATARARRSEPRSARSSGGGEFPKVRIMTDYESKSPMGSGMFES